MSKLNTYLEDEKVSEDDKMLFIYERILEEVNSFILNFLVSGSPRQVVEIARIRLVIQPFHQNERN
jgi:hypothetical protein